MPPFFERLGFVGYSYREVGFDGLGSLALPDDASQRRELAAALRGELVYLSTCNRVECYVLLSEPAQEGELRERTQAFFARRGVEFRPEELRSEVGPKAARHLFEVAAALQSLVVGETEIAGQVRRAVVRAQSDETAGPQLLGLVERALACAKRVRRETQIGELSLSVSSLAVRKINDHFGSQGPRSSVVIGVGDMSRKVVRALKAQSGAKDILLVNRTRSRAESLAAELGVRAASFEELRASPPERLDLLFSATSSTTPLVDPSLFARRQSGSQTVVVDLGVPADVHPEVAGLPGVRLVAMRHLTMLAERNSALLQEKVAMAHEIVSREMRVLGREAKGEHLVASGLETLFSDGLCEVAAEDKALLRSFFSGLVGRLARQPQTARG